MKSAKLKTISIILCVCILLGMVYNLAGLDLTNAASPDNEAISGAEASGVTLKSNTSKDRGTKENPFVVLEIVPTLDQAQFGYFIPGCEPVDLELMEREYNTVKGMSNLCQAFDITSNALYSYYEEIPENTPYNIWVGTTAEPSYEYYSTREFQYGYLSINSTHYSTWYQDSSNEGCQREGYFERVANGTGNFNIKVNTSNYSYNKVSLSVDSNGTVANQSFYFAYQEGGDYVWHESEESGNNVQITLNGALMDETVLQDSVQEGTRIWTTRNDLFRCNAVTFENKDTFVKEVLGEDSTEFISKVVTMTPEDLDENPDIIDQADMIFIHTAHNTTATVSLWRYSHGVDDTLSASVATNDIDDFTTHDFSNALTLKIMERMVGKNPAALVFDMPQMWKGTSGSSGTSNLFKLTLMTMQYPVDQFAKLGLLDEIKTQTENHWKNDTTTEESKKTLYYDNGKNGGNAYKWNQDTLRYVNNKDCQSKMQYYNINSGGYNVMNYIFSYQGDNSLFQLLYEKTTYINNSYSFNENYLYNNNNMEDMIEYYGAVDGAKYTVMDALAFILSGKTLSLPKLRVLEIQPCSTFIYGNDGWQDYYENLIPGYSPSSSTTERWVEDPNLLEVTTMATWEFIGTTGQYEYGQTDANGNPVKLTTDSSDDLLAKYDLIIIGSNQDDSNGLSGYNDSSLSSVEKVSKENANTIQYTNPNNWSNVYVFMWTDGVGSNADWPGTKMTKTSDGSWIYPNQDKWTKLIFNNGTSGNENQTADLVYQSNAKYTNYKKSWSSSSSSSGNSEYKMSTLIYSSVGDLTTSNDISNSYKGNSGSKVADTKTQITNDGIRYSSNDITLKKLLELEDFLKAGKPIVVDSALYSDPSNKTVDTGKVDQSSKIYDLLTWKESKEGNGAEQNLLVHKNNSGTYYSSIKIRSQIRKSQCNLVFYDDEDAYPLEYNYEEDSSGKITSEYYQQKDAEGNAILTYHFRVEGNSSYKYQVSLYVDSNGDGVYSSSLKETAEAANMSEATGKTYTASTAEKALEMTIYEVKNGIQTKIGTSKKCELQVNHEYYATYQLPEDSLGIVPWKLEVNAVGNTCLRSSAVDYTAFAATQEKKRINVLQMCLSRDMKTEWYTSTANGGFTSFTGKSVEATSYFDADHDYTNYYSTSNPDGLDDDDLISYTNSYYNELSTAAKKNVDNFTDYIKPVNEFCVNIQFLKNADWYKMFGPGAKKKSGATMTNEERLAAWESFLSQYDMIVLGFIDGDTFAENTIYKMGFQDFVNQGKGVILSHDTVGSSNMLFENTSEIYYGFGCYTPWLRTLSGQRQAYYNKNSDGTYTKSYMERQSNGNLIDTETDLKKRIQTRTGGTYSSLKAAISALGDKKYTNHYYQFAQDSTDINTSGIDTTTVRNDADIVDSDLLGSYALEMMDNNNQLYVRMSSGQKSDRANCTAGNTWTTSAETTTVELTNTGQITTYPYHIPKAIQVMKTHTQNYALDLEYLEGGDVNVWFNLSNIKTRNSKISFDSDGNYSYNSSSLYASRAQDSRNNFYIYNKGNITYTGSGHTGGTMPIDEVMLFINTMISAYRAPEEVPYVTIDNADSFTQDSSTKIRSGSIYVDYEEGSNDVLDSRVVERNGQKMVRVEISIHDDNSRSTATNKKYHLTVMDTSGSGTQLEVYQTGSSSPLSKNSAGEVVVTTTDTYEVYIPYDTVKQNGETSFQAIVYATFKRGGTNQNNKAEASRKPTNGTVTLMPLFDLN